MTAKEEAESHIDFFIYILTFEWCPGQSMPEMSIFEILFSIFSPGLIHVYEET